MHANPPPRRARRGSLAVELLLLTPVLLALVAAAVELSLLMAAQQKLEAASAVGARVASQGGNQEEVVKAVNEALGQGKLARARTRASLLGEDRLPLPAGAPVEVVVSVEAGEVVPDLLAFFGLSIKDVTISGRTLLRKE